MNNDNLQTQKTKLILKNRAQALSKKIDLKSTRNITSILVFDIGTQDKYGIRFSNIEKVIESSVITPIPLAPEAFSGLLYYNSEVWPVISLRKLFLSKSNDVSLSNNFILINNDIGRFALEINQISEQKTFDELETLTTLANENNTFFHGIYQSEITILNINSILKHINNMHVQ
jgi:chemotaxis signal transduction protein